MHPVQTVMQLFGQLKSCEEGDKRSSDIYLNVSPIIGGGVEDLDIKSLRSSAPFIRGARGPECSYLLENNLVH